MSHHKQRGRGKVALSAAEAEKYAKMGVTPGRHAAQASGGAAPANQDGLQG